jgi:hypothetical protein
MPVWTTPAMRVSGSHITGEGSHLDAIKLGGGELVVARNGSDTLWTHAPIHVSGIVTDAVTTHAIAGARVLVDGTDSVTLSDASGHFTVGGLALGDYTFQVHTESLDSLGIVARVPITVIDSVAIVDVLVPNAREISARGSPVSGKVLTDSTGTPIADVEVLVPAVGMGTRSDANGSFRIGHVPAGEYQILVRRVGYAPLSANINVGVDHPVERTIYLDHVVPVDPAGARQQTSKPATPRTP